MMFRFANPEFLYALYLLPVMAAVYWLISRSARKDINRFAGDTMQRILIPSFSRLKGYFKFAVILIALGLLIIAAANPQVGSRIQEVKQTGIDVFILLDVSLSMKAEDIKPNRLERAKMQISNLINKLRGDRIGLIVFSGEAYVQIPLTTDYSAANLFLNAVDFNTVPQPGTAIGPAIELALRSFNYDQATQKAIIIITDGEENQGNPMSAVTDAVSKDIKIYTIGLGSPDGVPIPVYSGNQMTFKKDRGGNTVLTKLDESTLIEIASAGKGRYYHGNNYQDQLNEIYNDLSSLEKTEFGVKKITDYEDRFYYFLLPAILLLLFEIFISEKRSVIYSRISSRFERKNV
jgi:Ca-activated chloride channel homolog